MADTVDDAAAVEAVTRLRPGTHHGFDIASATLLGGEIELEITSRRGEPSAFLRVAAPSSGRDQYWIYVIPRDATDWAEQLFAWIEEEVATGGLDSSRIRVDEGGRSFVVALSYGWQLSGRAEHERLLAAAPAGGWYDGGLLGA